jgi:hypothetical protein
MTFAWYGHLKYRSEALWKVIAASWESPSSSIASRFRRIALDRMNSRRRSSKPIQEVITLTVFAVFSVSYLGEKLKWNYAAGFACIVLAVFFVFHKW